MIFCKLKGGLGNIMFQIAGSLGIAKKHNLNTCFYNLESHLDYLNGDNYYNEKLNHSKEYMFLFKNLNFSCGTPLNLGKINYPFEYVEYNIHDNLIIEGFFQSEKYFNNIREELLEQFKEPFNFNEIVKEKYPYFSKKTTSLHIRRGDYLKASHYHPIQSMEYINSSIGILDDVTDYFLIFSDDIEWCKENLINEKFIFIENEKDYIDLFLMSKCDNNIISNSSFSWWAAWLNKNKNKQIIAPKIWFGDNINAITSDIIPDTWLKL